MDFDPNAPAFGPGAEPLDQGQTAEDTDVKAAEVKVEEKVADETSEEESKVPYSRFKKFHDEAKQYKLEAEEWKSKAEALHKPEVETELELPEFWKKLYGDSDVSKEAWKVQSQANKELIKQARQEAVEAVRAEAREEAQRVETNLETIDQQLESVTDLVGHPLTENEQLALLDIVDEYTPKDEDGNYAGPMMPFEKAWDIYQLQQNAGNASKIKSRNQVASITNTKTQGENSVDSKKDENWNPRDWNAWQKRI